MLQYFARRFLLMIPTLLGISMIIFIIMHFVPGGPVEQALYRARMASMGEAGAGGGGGAGVQNIPQEAIEEMKKAFGFDKPWYTRYFYWLANVLQLDLGKSYRTYETVTSMIASRFPVSIYFGLLGFVLSYLVCIPLGVVKAIRHGSTFDFASSAIVFVGYSIPGFALGTVLLVLLGGGSFPALNYFPLGKFRTTAYADLPSIVKDMESQEAVSDEFGDFQWEKMSLPGKIIDQLWHTALPLICYMVGSFAVLTVLMKNSLLENLGQDYVRTAYAKGLNERRVMFLHVLRNSLIPISTGLGHAIGILMAGSYLIERVFNIDGIGMLGYTSLINRDYPVALGILMLNALLTLLGNILSDVIYAIVDPRIRFS
jgi:microcin C transport system permease protein